MSYKAKKYTAIVKKKGGIFIKYRAVSGWQGVDRLKKYLSRNHNGWMYFNLYDSNKKYVKRIYNNKR